MQNKNLYKSGSETKSRYYFSQCKHDLFKHVPCRNLRTEQIKAEDLYTSYQNQ